MYDGGNMINVPANSAEKVIYKANCTTGTVNGESYIMSVMNSGISTLWFQNYTKDTISISGNNGADHIGNLSTCLL